MDKTLLYAKWFCENNNRINKELLNKLCYYASVMFTVTHFQINMTDNLTLEEIKVLKIINRVFGYADVEDLQIEYNDNFIEKMQQIYECYKNEDLNERLEIINNRYFFVQNDVEITQEEYKKLCLMPLNEDNVTYYVSRNEKGILEVY